MTLRMGDAGPDPCPQCGGARRTIQVFAEDTLAAVDAANEIDYEPGAKGTPG
jgi:hypothetical protein